MKKIVKSNIILFFFLSLSCNNKDKIREQLLISKDGRFKCEVFHFQDSINIKFYSKDKRDEIDDFVSYKKGDYGFYDKNKRLVLSTHAKNIFYYNVIGKKFYCEIKKSDFLNITTFGNVDSLDFKYKFVFKYDDNFMFEEVIMNEDSKSIILKKS